MRNVRKWAADYVPVAFIVGACFAFPVGGVAFSIVTGVAGGVATRPTEQALNWCRKRTCSGGAPVNHDLQEALRRSYVKAITHLELVWGKSYQRDAVKPGQGENDEAISSLFRMLREDVDDILSDQRLKAFAGSSEAIQRIGRGGGGAGWLTRFLEPYLYGHNEQISRFLSQSLEPNLSCFFAEELKTDTNAWRAFQRLVVDSLHQGFHEVQRAQRLALEHDQIILKRLDVISERLDTIPDDVRLPDGEDGLDKAIADARDHVIEVVVEQGVLTRDAVLETFVALSDQIADLDGTVRSGFDGIHKRLDSVIEIVTKAAPIPDRAVSGQELIVNVPRRNPHFFGRDSELASLAAMAEEPGSREARVRVLHGLGGVGKTQLVTEFAHRYEARYAGIWWLNAGDPSALVVEFARLATALDLPASRVNDTQLAADAAQRFLEATEGAHERWLLIFDNADKPDDLHGLIPRRGNIDVLITSRSRLWDGEYSAVPVDLLSPEESREFLLRRTGEADQAFATELAAELDRLPLALEQAAAYIVALPSRNLRSYLAQFRDDPAVALDRNKPGTGGYHKTVARTWAISFGAVETESPPAADLIRLLAYFAPDVIPLDIIATYSEQVPDPLRLALADPGLDVVEVAYRYSLIKVDSFGDVSMHRLVQRVSRDQLTDLDKEKWARVALSIVDNALPADASDYQGWSVASRLHTHGIAVSGEARRLGLELEAVASVRDRIGAYLASQGDYPGARMLHAEALALRRQVLPAEHPDIAASLNDLALVLESQGDYPGARALFEQALAIRRRVLPVEHPAIATSLNNLAGALARQGDYPRAHALHEEALAMRRRVLPAEHFDIAMSLNNLAGVLAHQGDRSGARALHEESLAMRRSILPAEHPAIATSLNNLGLVLESQGDYAGARALYEEALALRRGALPDEHPDIATIINNLALVLARQGDYRGARALHEDALALRRQVLPPDHPDIAMSLNNLALVLTNQGDYRSARIMHEEALALRRRALPGEHPDIALSLNNLAGVLARQGDYPAARALYEEALALRRRVLPAEHPDIATSLNNLAFVLARQGNNHDARPLHEEALALLRRVLPAEHPDIATSLNNLATVLENQGDYPGARALYEQALALRRRVLPARHPHIPLVLENLARVLHVLGKSELARSYEAEAAALRSTEDEESDSD